MQVFIFKKVWHIISCAFSNHWAQPSSLVESSTPGPSNIAETRQAQSLAPALSGQVKPDVVISSSNPQAPTSPQVIDPAQSKQVVQGLTLDQVPSLKISAGSHHSAKSR